MFDGVDQAKFRVPRVLTKTHAFDNLIRPTLHVQGAWCEGFAYHFDVADAGIQKNNNNNLEVIARLIDDMYQKYGALPLAISLIQDNTSRELNIPDGVEIQCEIGGPKLCGELYLSVSRAGPYPWALDVNFGQTCAKLSLEEFEDDMDVVDILDHFLKTSGLDAGTREGAKAYKLDEATEWVKWAEEVDLAMSALTGPAAPHYFRICRRKHLGTLTVCGDGTAEAAACHRAEHRGYQPNGNDVVMVVKDRMASLEVSQIIWMVPVAGLGRLHGLPLQTQGTHLRRPAS